MDKNRLTEEIAPVEEFLSNETDLIPPESKTLLERLVRETKTRIVILYYLLKHSCQSYENQGVAHDLMFIESKGRWKGPNDLHNYFHECPKQEIDDITTGRWRPSCPNDLTTDAYGCGAIPFTTSAPFSTFWLLRYWAKPLNWTIKKVLPTEKEAYGGVMNRQMKTHVSKKHRNTIINVKKNGTEALSDEEFLDWAENGLIPTLEIVLAHYHTFSTEAVFEKLLKTANAIKILRSSGQDVADQLASLKDTEIADISAELAEIYEKVDGFRKRISELISGLSLSRGIGALAQSPSVQQGPHSDTGLNREAEMITKMRELRELSISILLEMEEKFFEV